MAHQTLNAVAQTVARSEEKLDSLSAAVSDLPVALTQSLDQLMKGSLDDEEELPGTEEELVQERNKCQVMKTALQSKSNRIQLKLNEKKQRTTQLV